MGIRDSRTTIVLEPRVSDSKTALLHFAHMSNQALGHQSPELEQLLGPHHSGEQPRLLRW